MSKSITRIVTPNNMVIEACTEGQVKTMVRLLDGINFKIEGYKWVIIKR